MSKAAWLTFGCTLTGTSVLVYLVHYKQRYDREQMRVGMAKDEERQLKKASNVLEFARQQELRQRLEAEQDKSAFASR